MIESLLTTPVTIVRPTTDVEDEYTETPTNATTATSGSLDQDSTTDQDGRGEVAVSQWTLFLGPDEDIDSDCAVLIGGTRYEVVGDPWLVEDKMAGTVHHIEVKLQRSGSGVGS